MNRKQKARIKHIILIISIILLSRNSWRDIPKYYKSIFYVSFVNILYYLMCRRHLVWEFTPIGINWWFIRIVHVIIITPLLVLIFLAKFPNSLFKQVIYTVNWVVMSSAVEYFLNKHKLIIYSHGWNIFWTGLIYAKMYVYSYLITKNPFITWFLSLCSVIFFTIKFKVPMRRKHISSKFDRFVDIYYHSFLEDIFCLRKSR